jgi:hypothetical protein
MQTKIKSPKTLSAGPSNKLPSTNDANNRGKSPAYPVKDMKDNDGDHGSRPSSITHKVA